MDKQGSIILALGGRPGMQPSAMPGLKYQKRRTVVIFTKDSRPGAYGHTNQQSGLHNPQSIPAIRAHRTLRRAGPKVYERPPIPQATKGGYLGGKTFPKNLQAEKCSRNHGSRLTCLKCAHTDLPTLDVLRSIAPHVAGRWREVAQDLGLSFDDVLTIERQNPMSKTSELASRALEMWWKRGRTSQELLKQVLSQHQLLAATAIVSNRGIPNTGSPDAEIPRIPHRLPKRPTTSSQFSRPSTSSGVYICTSTTGNPTVQQLLPRRDSLSNSIASNDSRGTTPNIAIRRSALLVQNKERSATNVHPPKRQVQTPSVDANKVKGRLLVRIFIERVEPDDTHAKRLQLQRTLLRHESAIVAELTNVANLSQIQIHHKWTGVMTIIMSYSDQPQINRLIAKEKEHDGPLKSALRHILTDKSVLTDAEAAEIQYKMELFNDTRQQVTSTDSHLTNHGSITRVKVQQIVAGRREEVTTPWTKPTVSKPTETEKVLKTLKPIRSKIKEELSQIRQEYNLFHRNILEFLSVLKSTKPTDVSSISSQSDVLRCYVNFKNIAAAKRPPHGERLQEFLSLVDCLAEFCDEIHKDFLHWQSDANTEGIGEKELLLPLAEKLNNMLDPTYNFNVHNTESNQVLHPEDQKHFSGLLNFIPEVINHLDELLQIIAIQIDARQRQCYHLDKHPI